MALQIPEGWSDVTERSWVAPDPADMAPNLTFTREAALPGETLGGQLDAALLRMQAEFPGLTVLDRVSAIGIGGEEAEQCLYTWEHDIAQITQLATFFQVDSVFYTLTATAPTDVIDDVDTAFSDALTSLVVETSGRVRITPPTGWLDRSVFAFEAPRHADIGYGPALSLSSHGAARTLAVFVAEQVTRLATSLPGFELLEQNVAQVAGMPAIELGFHWQPPNGSLTQRVKVFGRANDLWSFATSALRGGFEQHRSIFEEIESTLQFRRAR